MTYRLGVDSTALLSGLAHRGMRPDLVLFADCGGEKIQTYLYAPIFHPWLRDVDFPQFEVVRELQSIGSRLDSWTPRCPPVAAEAARGRCSRWRNT
jgi:hypothetical protein